MRVRFGELELNDKRFTLSGPDGVIHVEPQVFEVHHHLILNHDRVVSKEELLDTIWGDRFVSESALTSRIKAARRAVGDDGKGQRVIKTVHGRGYQFVAEIRTDAVGTPRDLPRLRNEPLGRDDDVATVAERLLDVPLVTIIGSGGIGKTTVALVVAERLQADFADGVVFVDLAPVPPEADITRAVADAAGIEGSASETLDGVAVRLASQPALLVLDNCEHVVGRAAELVDRMLDRSGRARVLATSREPLGVAGEHVWPLGPLHDDGPRLFVERARAAEPRVHWDPADPAVIDLCRRLDDVPLALELAAGQLRRFDIGELHRRLGDQLALLASPATGDAERHATMEMTIDWSYQLLDATEQCLLRHLGVFPSSFDVHAVEASAPPLTGTDPLAVLGQLVDKSLVVRQPGSGRYRLLETIRAFARSRLVGAGEEAAAFERHRRGVRQRIGSRSRLDRWMSARLGAELRADLDDARQAFGLSLQRGQVADAVEVALGGSFLWRNAVGCAEGDEWIDALLGLELSPHDQLWVQILRTDVGQGRGAPGQMFEATAAAEDVLNRTEEDAAGECLVAHYRALASLTDPNAATPRLRAALDLAHRSRDARLVTLLGAFAAVADLAAGANDQARSALARLEPAASEDGYDRFIVHWAGWMLALAERDGAAAWTWMGRQQDYLDRTGIVETWITSFSTAMCGAVDGSEVRGRLARTLALAAQEGYRAEADCVLLLAYAEMCGGRFESAAELIGTAAHGRFNATAHYVLYRAVLEPMLRQHLDEPVVAAAMARGRSQSAAEALAVHGVASPVDADGRP